MNPDRDSLLPPARLAAQELTYEAAFSGENSKMSREQKEFIAVLGNLCRRSINLPSNPLGVLDREIYQAWVQAQEKFEQRQPEYLVHQGRRIRRYGTDGDALRAARPVIEQWATTFFLGASWIIDNVERRFRQRLEQSRGPLFGEWPKATIRRWESPPPPPPDCMGIITIPLRQKGVTRSAHKKACYRLVDECIAKHRLSSRAKLSPASRKFKIGKYEYRHVDFLALRICGMQWDEIRRRYRPGGYKGTAKAVMAGAKDVALKIGLPWPIRLKPRSKK